MKHKFKIGDKIRIAKFPMGMSQGDSPSISVLYSQGTIFKVTGFTEGLTRDYGLARIPCFFTEIDWYFDEESCELASKFKGPPKPRKLRSWSLT